MEAETTDGDPCQVKLFGKRTKDPNHHRILAPQRSRFTTRTLIVKG